MTSAGGPTLHDVDTGGARLRVAVQGEGPLVLLCHGFPESWRSWRHQLAALAAAGFRAAAPDMRGYGGSDAPADPSQYTQLHVVGDLVGLVQALGETEAVIVGHDWGAPSAWHAALLRPDLFRAVVGMSVAYSPPAAIDLLTLMEQRGVTTFYMQHFAKPGVAEAELEADAAASIRRITWSLSGDHPGGVAGILPPGAGFLDLTSEPPAGLPAWWDAADIAAVGDEFARTGFRGALNWYRAMRLNTALLAPWRGCPIRQPSMFIAGTNDDVLRFPGTRERLQRLPEVLPGLRGQHLLEGAGHWIQRERAEEVSRLLVDFVRGL